MRKQISHLFLVLGPSFYENLSCLQNAYIVVWVASSGARIKVEYLRCIVFVVAWVLFSSNRCWPRVSLGSCLSAVDCMAEIDKSLWRPVCQVMFSRGLVLQCNVWKVEVEKLLFWQFGIDFTLSKPGCLLLDLFHSDFFFLFFEKQLTFPKHFYSLILEKAFSNRMSCWKGSTDFSNC